MSKYDLDPNPHDLIDPYLKIRILPKKSFCLSKDLDPCHKWIYVYITTNMQSMSLILPNGKIMILIQIIILT